MISNCLAAGTHYFLAFSSNKKEVLNQIACFNSPHGVLLCQLRDENALNALTEICSTKFKHHHVKNKLETFDSFSNVCFHLVDEQMHEST